MKAGFIGLGAMGQPMARNLHRAGLLVGAWNRTASKATALAAETGCRAFATPAELAAACDAVVTCVSADDDLLAVVDAHPPDAESRRRRHRLLDGCGRHRAYRGGPPRRDRRRLPRLPGERRRRRREERDARDHVRRRPGRFERARPVLEALGKTIC